MNEKIESSDLLDHPILLEEKERILYIDEIRDFLPRDIIDCHTHICLSKDIGEISEERKRTGVIAAAFPVERLLEAYRVVFKEKKVRPVCFPLPYKEVNIEQNNEYVREAIGKYGVFGLVTPEVHATENEIRKLIEEGKFIGFKPYPDLVPGREQNDESINVKDYVTPAMLKVADNKQLILMLHLPKKDRLADPENIKEIREIATRYPNVSIVIAHFGRSFCPDILEKGSRKVMNLENVYFDNSMVTEPEVYEFAFRELSSDKILFGTDAPLCFLRGKRPCLREGRIQKSGMSAWYVKEEVPWITPEERKTYEDEIDKLILFAYECVLCIKKACNRLGLKRKDMEAIFRKNAETIINKAQR